jgi:hypothetical protein
MNNKGSAILLMLILAVGIFMMSASMVAAYSYQTMLTQEQTQQDSSRLAVDAGVEAGISFAYKVPNPAKRLFTQRGNYTYTGEFQGVNYTVDFSLYESQRKIIASAGTLGECAVATLATNLQIINYKRGFGTTNCR